MGKWQQDCLSERNIFNQNKGWESALERRASQTIYSHAEKFNITYHYQYRFGTQCGGMDEQEFESMYGFIPDEFESSSWDCEKYRADFFLEELELIIELDGWWYHKDKKQSDEKRDKDFESLGIRVLHIPQDYLDSYFFSDWLYNKIVDRINEL